MFSRQILGEDVPLVLEAGDVKADQIKFLAGYSGWNSKQLEKEIHADNWWVTGADKYSILIEEPTVMWGKVLTGMGHVYGILNDFPEDPGLN